MMPFLEVVTSGGGATIQDLGRSGWKRFGIPPGGAMDLNSARKANLLVGNPEGEAVIELLFTGARFRILKSAELAITGAAVDSGWPRWRNFEVRRGQVIAFATLRSGVWSYLAVRGGFIVPKWFGSASVDPRAGCGEALGPKVRLAGGNGNRAAKIASRFVPEFLQESYDQTPVLPVWPGPEWHCFPKHAREMFLSQAWVVSRFSDRTGYRLEGSALTSELRISSAPVAVGTIQVPPNGLPIVLLRDGPTVGGYPRLSILDPSAVSRFTQCAPSTSVRFKLVEQWTSIATLAKASP
ncbi:MAG TPA: biotin-dependent carboxyltransferase family protein [Terrimicrobiaceae bacterium]